jgi:hypothetical protein
VFGAYCGDTIAGVETVSKAMRGLCDLRFAARRCRIRLGGAALMTTELAIRDPGYRVLLFSVGSKPHAGCVAVCEFYTAGLQSTSERSDG